MLRHTVLFVLLLLTCRIGAAQNAAARLECSVKDPSGALVPTARVSATNRRTGSRAEAPAASAGLFIFPSLAAGVYALRIEAAGFCTVLVPELELNAGTTVSQNIVLQVGDISSEIVVQAGTERIQTSDAQIARAATPRDIQALPQRGRDPMILALFSAGVQINTRDQSLSHVNGTRDGSNDARLDGIDVSDNSGPRFLWTNLSQNQDSIEETRIVTSGGKAEFGRTAGGQIQMTTRSGTNSWHGNAFEYHRNTVLNANTFFGNSSDLERPAYVQNTFGASLGGPIRRGRTFIFGNYQGRRNAQELIRNRLVLTKDAKAGLFRWRDPVTSELQEPFDIVAHDPRGLGIDRQIASLLALLPDPNNLDIGDGLNTAGYRFNNPAIAYIDDFGQDQFTIKADHQLWGGHQIFFRWSWDRTSFIDSPNNEDARFEGQPPGIQDFVKWGYSIGSNWTTPLLANELRIGAASYTNDLLRPARLKGPMLLSNSWTDPLNPDFPQRFEPSMTQIADGFTFIRGKHIFKAGGEARFTRDARYSDAGIWPNVTFANNLGNAPKIGPSGDNISPTDRQSFEKLYNDLLGRMNLVTQTFYSDMKSFQPAGEPRVRIYRYNELGFFFQDDWKVHPRLVVNLGLRYEFFGVPYEVSGHQATVENASLINSTAQVGNLTIQSGGRMHNSDFNNFAPRAGLAWDPAGDGRTAIRANWGVYYDRLPGRTVNFVGANTPGIMYQQYNPPNLTGGDIRVSDGIPELHPPAVPEPCPPTNRLTNLALFNPDSRTGYVQHYSFTVQREIFRNTVLEAGYVGAHGTKLFMGLNYNQPRIYEDYLPSFRQLQDYQNYGTPVPASNTLVKIYGSVQKAINAIGANAIEQGTVGSSADTMDRFSYTRYGPAGVSNYYLRNYPQFNRVLVATNDGRSYYNSFQSTFRRNTGALKFAANYTFSKSMDDSSAEAFPNPVDSYNVRLQRARSDYDIPHAFNLTLDYSLPFGKGQYFAGNAPRWVDFILGGWDTGLITVWQSGNLYSCFSGIATGPTTDSSFCDYSGDRNIGKVMRRADGVYWLTDEEIGRFSLPKAGETGSSGRNAFRGPRFFIVDLSLRKSFRIGEGHTVSLRAEAYNLFNNVNFDVPNANLSEKSTFGKISGTVPNPRILQVALRYDF